MERGQFGGRVGAQFVGEGAPGLLVHGERLGGLPTRVQGPHQLPVQPLAQWMRGRQRPHLRHQLRPAPEPEPEISLDSILYGGQPQLVEPGPLGVRVGEVGQRRVAPQGEGLAQPGGGLAVLAGGEGGAALLGQMLEAVDVDGVGSGGDPVAGGARFDLGVRGQTAS